MLDQKLLDDSNSADSGHILTQVKPTNLKLDFKMKIREQCQLASKANPPENVLVLMFGHGDRDSKGITIGVGSRAIFKRENFADALKGMNVNLTLITTHCYSGGWTCYPSFNISSLTAAGIVKESRSWAKSGSCGRACGSMFTTALIQKLCQNTVTGLPVLDDDTELDESQEETYEEFVRAVYENLLSGIDRRGYEHAITFGAQDDAWEMCWRERTGIPLGTFQSYWENLDDWPRDMTLHPGDPQNRDPKVTAEQEAEWASLKDKDAGQNEWNPKKNSYEAIGALEDPYSPKRKTSALYGGSKGALESVVCALATQYLESYRGNDDTGNDGGLHGRLFSILKGNEKDPLMLEEAHRVLQYRMEQISTADEYLESMGIPIPKGQLCCDYNTNVVLKEVGDDYYESVSSLIFERKVLFPAPIPDQGRPFYKGHSYMIAAFHSAGISREEIINRLDNLAARLDEDLEYQREFAKRDANLSSKRRKLFTALGVKLGNLSPIKRRSQA